ncbi:glycoside hydrolase family 71/99-like protein [Hufsiella ginkgonis]|uniref:Xylosidase n=1 Tax=Hufsiella ginkgonis TaxID=2695274 RepID=A0A7K1XY66_9SPHI|nr:glycoside hydrolase family 71/99-like protein [Hufsiella ginkgonis]MXV15476.1 hypothetical protein [Hufsiella ginkgonis]
MKPNMNGFKARAAAPGTKKSVAFGLLAIALVSCSQNDLYDGSGSESSGNKFGASVFGSPVGDVVGKVTVGYQGWFAAAGDGSPYNSWQHQNLEMWPDCSEYTSTYAGSPFTQAGVTQPGYFGNLGNGQPAKMFSSYDQQVSNVHALWMQQNGIDCIALQRFGSAIVAGSVKKAQFDGIATRMKNAAQTYGRKFYIMYDCSATDPIDADWTSTITGTLNLVASPNYAKQNGKPVVCFWGVGKSGRGTTADWLTKINWFKAQGCYVIGAPLANFATDTPNQPAYNACDMIMPWHVGKQGGFQATYTSDLAYCNANGLDYQAMSYPGTAFYNTNGASSPQNQIKRMYGNFMWSQFAGMRNAGVQSVYVAMFDEAQEATSIFKCAEDASQIPAGKYFLTLDADGVACSKDFYLRLVNNGGKMVKGIIPYQATHTTPYTNYLDVCDASTGWISANTLSVNTTDKKEGTASLQSVGSGTDEFKKVFTPFNSGASVATGKIQFWYYVSDITRFSASNQIEVGSGGAADVNEYNWNIGPLVNGWNLVTKTFATASTTGGTPNLNAINWIRIYHSKTASITTKVDAIQVFP